jgi:multiple sugar transport system permease protein
MYKKSRAGIFFLLPGVIWILIFTLFPLVYSLVLSFTDRQLANPNSGRFIGLTNYGTALSGMLNGAVPAGSPFRDIVAPIIPANADLRVWDTVVASVFMSLGSVIVTIVLGVAIAWLFNHDIPLIRVFRSVMTMPLFAAPVALGFLGLILFNEQSGIVNYVVRGFTGGQYIPWLTQPWWARTAVLLIDAWQWTPFVFIVVLAAMQSIPIELIEAARLDTNSSLTLFRKITLPLIAPALGTIAMLRLVETFKILDIPLSMLGGGPGSATQTYSYYTYQVGLKNFQMGYGSALAYLLVIVCIIISTIYFRRMGARYEQA